MVSFIWYMVALVCAVAAAGVGMNFSPSFTAMFVVVFLGLTALGEAFLYFKEHRYQRVFKFLGRLFPALGALLVLPASYMYAAGDDWIDACLNIALIASVILLVIYLLCCRRLGRKYGIAAGIETWVLLAAGIFTLACAIPSTALWPYGLGILLIVAARRLGDTDADKRLSRGVMVAGMFLCAVFLVAPMVCFLFSHNIPTILWR